MTNGSARPKEPPIKTPPSTPMTSSSARPKEPPARTPKRPRTQAKEGHQPSGPARKAGKTWAAMQNPQLTSPVKRKSPEEQALPAHAHQLTPTTPLPYASTQKGELQ